MGCYLIRNYLPNTRQRNKEMETVKKGDKVKFSVGDLKNGFVVEKVIFGDVIDVDNNEATVQYQARTEVLERMILKLSELTLLEPKNTELY